MKTHKFDLTSFVFGGLFVGLGSLFIADTRPWARLAEMRWAWTLPALAVLVGFAIIRPLVTHSNDQEPIDTTSDDLLAAHETLEVEVPPSDV